VHGISFDMPDINALKDKYGFDLFHADNTNNKSLSDVDYS